MPLAWDSFRDGLRGTKYKGVLFPLPHLNMPIGG